MRVLTGIQASGKLHIGNYFGAMKPMIELQEEHELFTFIANYHSLTTSKDAATLKQYTIDAAVDYLSLGLDPEKTTFWVQSAMPEVLELYWILSKFTPMGLLERAHSYKDKVAKGIAANHALFSYPVLMAADILILATPATLKGDKYQQLVNVLVRQKDVEFFEQACPGLVEQIEKGEMHDSSTKMMLEMWLTPMRDNSVDTIVLGCTHYPLVGEMIEKVMQRDLNLIHTGEAIAKRLLTLGQEKGHDNDGELKITLYSTDEIDKQIVSHILEGHTEVKQIDIEPTE